MNRGTSITGNATSSVEKIAKKRKSRPVKFAIVGEAGIGLGSNTSPGSLNAPETIQISGKTVNKASTAVRTNNTRFLGRDRIERRLVVSYPLVDFKASSPRQYEHGRRRSQQHENQERGHRRSVPVVVEHECLLVDIEDAQHGLVGRPPLSHDVDQVEGLQSRNPRDRGY